MQTNTGALQKQAKAVANLFAISGEILSVEPYGNGHINDTFLLVCASGTGRRRYILQRLNKTVFVHPTQVMDNIVGVTGFVREKIEKYGPPPDMPEVLTLVDTQAKTPYHIDEFGELWRLYNFVENTISFERATSAEMFYNSACAFGDFFMALAEYPSHTLYEAIPDFHNTPKRFRDFEQAVAADPLGRAATVQSEIDFIRQREKDIHFLRDLQDKGELPLRVTHNDTKLNNVLLSAETERGVCVIDLDTVMPGLSAYDFGDSIRFGATTCEEDETDLSLCHFSLEMYAAYARGYLARAGAALTPAEHEVLPMGAKLMTLECGMRFLTDYIEGDHYFKVHKANHNLHRCGTQFKLVADMEQEWGEMHRVLKEL